MLVGIYICIAIGIGLLLLGLFGRKNAAPPGSGWCRGCRYPAGGGAALCPECGADLTRAGATLAFLRVRRYRWIIPGVIVLLIGGAGLSLPVVARVRGIDPFTLMPTWLLLYEAKMQGEDAERARKELVARYIAAGLSPEQVRACIDAADLRFTQQPEGWNAPDADLIQQAWLNGDLSDEAMGRIMEKAWGQYVAIETRPVIRKGGSIWCRRTWTYFRLPGITRQTFVISIGEITVIDENGITLSPKRYYPRDRSGFSLNGMSLSDVTGEILNLDVGEHRLTYRFDYTLKSPHGSAVTWQHNIPAVLQVVPEDAVLTRAVPDETLRGAIRDAVIIDFEHQTVRLSPNSMTSNGIHSGYVGIERVPTCVAFEVYLRHHGKEELAGAFAYNPASGRSYAGDFLSSMTLRQRLGEGTQSVDVILRSSPRVTENEVELFPTIWDGEIIFENVPVSLDPLPFNP